jgi:hypothetical protein
MVTAFGFRTVRFTNDDVMVNLDGCLMHLQLVLNEASERWSGRRHHPPTPMPAPAKAGAEEEGDT